LDLGATDYFFVKYANFIEYEKFQMSMTGRIAKKKTSFEITRHEIERIVVKIANERIIDLTLYNILHILSLYFNFISISKIFVLGLAITFKENEVITSFGNSKTAIYGIRHVDLYHVRIVDEPKTFVIKLV